MQRNLVVVLGAVCFLLVVLSAYLAFALYQKPRFTQVSGSNPYVMFDQKTAQACWSGPASVPQDKFVAGLQSRPDAFWSPTNSANIPFCKDLK